jgi:hypothetical protein
MQSQTSKRDRPRPGESPFYLDALVALDDANVPFLMGGGYALEVHTGIRRPTKDLDIFIMPEDVSRTLDTLSAAGYETELTFPHWLGKAVRGEHLIDLIFNSGNGACPVDAEWFEHAVEGVFLGRRVKLCPPEEVLWQKAFVMERNRYDGADVAHILRTCGPKLDWPRLLRRFGPHWRVLLSHLVLYGFIYPADKSLVPPVVMRDLLDRLHADLQNNSSSRPQCRGTLLSLWEYRADLEHWGYADARLLPDGTLTDEQLAQWTAAFENEQKRSPPP